MARAGHWRRVVAVSAPWLVFWTSLATRAPAPDPDIDFACDVLPVLQRQGCASAYCHGAATGQGGFKLSLFGSDPQHDHAAIAHALGGRRIDLVDPAASLLLQKPTLAMRHGGGRRLRVDDADYARLRAWIAAGAPFARPAPRQLEALSARLDGAQLRVAARFAGHASARDVTDLATFSSSDELVATIDPAGQVTWHGPGEAWLLARYAGASARVASLRQFAAAATEATPAASALDAACIERARALGLPLAPPANPERIARRLFLDLAGRPPTTFELQSFLALPATDRVARTADDLLASPAFAAELQRRLESWLELTSARPRDARLRARLAEFAAADTSVRELTATLLAPGSDFLARHEDPRDRAELVGRTLLGLRIGCARCHDHPHDRWRQRDHLAFAACFADPRPAPGGGMTAGALFGPDGGAVPPSLLPLEGSAAAATRDLAGFVHLRSHDALARALCNRVFAWLFGRGLVEPLDDHRLTNPARHESWLAALQATFHAHDQRLRPLVRAIVTSRIYQLDSSAPDAADDDPQVAWLLRRNPKQLREDALRRALAAVCNVREGDLPALPSSPLARRLALLNGDALARGLSAPGNAIEALLTLGGSASEQLDELFRACLSRLPTADERELLLPDFVPRDLAVALLLSREFEFVR